MPRRAASKVRGKRTARALGANGITFLLSASEMPGATPTAIFRTLGLETKYATLTAERLKQAGLLELAPGPIVAGKPSSTVSLTARGRDAVEHLTAVVNLVESDAVPSRRRKRG